MDKVERTWTLNEKTVLIAKVLAAIFQITDSKLIENIIAVKAARTLAIYDALGVGVIALPPTGDNVPRSEKIVRKTVALTTDTYDKLIKVVKITGKRESNVVEDFVYEAVNTIHQYYPDLLSLIDAVLAVKGDEEPKEPGKVVLAEIYRGTMADRTKDEIAEKLALAFKKQP